MAKKANQTDNVELRSDIQRKKTFAEFFAGIGLMRMGLEREGWTIAYANDIAADKYEMYSDNFPDAKAHFVLGDIHQLNVEDAPTVALATASLLCDEVSDISRGTRLPIGPACSQSLGLRRRSHGHR